MEGMSWMKQMASEAVVLDESKVETALRRIIMIRDRR